MASMNTRVIDLTDGRQVFQSYGITVAAFIPAQDSLAHDFGYLRSRLRFSTTSSRHVHQWLEGRTAREVSHQRLLDLTAPVQSAK